MKGPRMEDFYSQPTLNMNGDFISDAEEDAESGDVKDPESPLASGGEADSPRIQALPLSVVPNVMISTSTMPAPTGPLRQLGQLGPSTRQRSPGPVASSPRRRPIFAHTPPKKKQREILPMSVRRLRYRKYSIKGRHNQLPRSPNAASSLSPASWGPSTNPMPVPALSTTISESYESATANAATSAMLTYPDSDFLSSVGSPSRVSHEEAHFQAHRLAARAIDLEVELWQTQDLAQRMTKKAGKGKAREM